MRFVQLMTTTCLIAGASGCVSTRYSQDKATDVQAAMRAAEEVGAPALPQAALHLQFAKQQLEDAEKLNRQGEPHRANMLLDRAQVDAELAIQLAQTEQEQKEAQEAWNKVKELRPEPAPSESGTKVN